MSVEVITESSDAAVVVTTDETTFGPIEQTDIEALQTQIDDLVADLATTNLALDVAKAAIVTLTTDLNTAEAAIVTANAAIGKLTNNQFARVYRKGLVLGSNADGDTVAVKTPKARIEGMIVFLERTIGRRLTPTMTPWQPREENNPGPGKLGSEPGPEFRSYLERRRWLP